MNKYFISSLLMMAAAPFAQAEQRVGAIADRPFVIYGGKPTELLNYSTYDSDADGVTDAIQVNLRLKGDVGILQENFISNKMPDPNGEIRQKIDKIIQSTRNSFGAFHGTYNSTLTLEGKNLIENLSITIKEIDRGDGRSDLETITLKTQTTKTLD